MTTSNEPQGSLVLRTLAHPSDTNVYGDIFGGWIMSQMDIAGVMFARNYCKHRMVTIGVESMKFLKPIKVGDAVCCYGKLVRQGTTSLTIRLSVWAQAPKYLHENSVREQVTEGVFTFVAVDENGQKRPLQA